MQVLVHRMIGFVIPRSVDTVMVDGRILMENRQLTTIDLDEVHAKCRELAPKLAARAKVKPVSRWPIV